MDTANDYYGILGIDPQASGSTIKAAFKKLALQYHPDVYQGDDAEERMRDLLQAYRTLNDPEARKTYDARLRGETGASASRSGSPIHQAKKPTPEGRGHYAFPDLREVPGSAITFSLDGTSYRLSSAQAESLKWDGLLRGTLPSTGASYTCQRCYHRWSARGAAHPANCPACSARDWDEYLLLRCTHCQAVFASKELRDPLRGNSLYRPYDLFPLCPQCKRSQWCPAENNRIQALRAAAARRAVLLWGSAVGIGVVVLAILAFVILRG